MGRRTDPDEQALKEYLKQEEAMLSLAEEEKKKRKDAARIWFNTMEELWPPDNSPEYWTKACEKCRDVFNEAKDNLLLRKLMVTLYDYLGEWVKEHDETDQ